MLQFLSCAPTIFLFVFLFPCLIVSANPFIARSLFEADHLAQCRFVSSKGTFNNELLWQSGNTIETISNTMITSNATSRWLDLLQSSYQNTPAILDNCFDDHQWWLLAWVRAYRATSNVNYVRRAATIFDYVVANGWTSLCGGGVLWCPAPTSPYKNAITNELFLASAIGLHPYASILQRPTDFYLQWALKAWNWFESSGMLNGNNLINDGLNGQCKNNGGTTWTYNQGVILGGLSGLVAATNNRTLLSVATGIAKAAIGRLTRNGILVEPCNGQCDNDQRIFKGVFMRHLGYLITANPQTLDSDITNFIVDNANSIIAYDSCKDGGYGVNWQGPCDNQEDTATSTAALDALVAASQLRDVPSAQWVALGLGNCADMSMQSMPNCYADNVDESACRSVAAKDARSVAYDLQIRCDGGTFCRVRTLSTSCPSGWSYGGGPATTVTTTNGDSGTICVIKASS